MASSEGSSTERWFIAFCWLKSWRWKPPKSSKSDCQRNFEGVYYSFFKSHQQTWYEICFSYLDPKRTSQQLPTSFFIWWNFHEFSVLGYQGSTPPTFLKRSPIWRILRTLLIHWRRSCQSTSDGFWKRRIALNGEENDDSCGSLEFAWDLEIRNPYQSTDGFFRWSVWVKKHEEGGFILINGDKVW